MNLSIQYGCFTDISYDMYRLHKRKWIFENNNISSQNRLKSTHALALVLTQNQAGIHSSQSDHATDTFPHIIEDDMKKDVTPNINIQHYIG